mmetsp:Transcript_11321/g.21451  ORF Transcript_11321/g.21451 Transcript_11321/m.21451 type:complete len:214 (+) Transcript_11321:520-1161(+)
MGTDGQQLQDIFQEEQTMPLKIAGIAPCVASALLINIKGALVKCDMPQALLSSSHSILAYATLPQLLPPPTRSIFRQRRICFHCRVTTITPLSCARCYKIVRIRMLQPQTFLRATTFQVRSQTFQHLMISATTLHRATRCTQGYKTQHLRRALLLTSRDLRFADPAAIATSVTHPSILIVGYLTKCLRCTQVRRTAGEVQSSRLCLGDVCPSQ